jgi:carbon storage regulator
MLVLTRKVNEKIKIGDDIIISILEIGKGGVRVGIEAPRSVSVHRQEVYDKIQEENLKASQGLLSNIESLANLLRKKGYKEQNVED